MTTSLQKFIDELQLRGRSPLTQKHYARIISALTRHYQRPPDQISDDELKQYLLHLLRERKLAASTLVVTVSAFRFYYRHVLHRPTTAIEEALPRMKAPTTQPRIYSPQEVERLLNVPGLNPKHRVLLITTYAAGLRVSEVCRLKVTDIISARMQIRIEQGKGQKDRYTLLSPKLLAALRGYWRLYRPRHWLFPSAYHPDRPLTTRTAERVFNRAATLAGLPNHDGIHSLRHSFATHLLERGVDVIVLQRLLGHTNLATTAGYLHVRQERIAQLKSPLELIQIHSFEPRN